MGRKRELVINEVLQGASSQQPPTLTKKGASRSGNRVGANPSDAEARPRMRLPTWSFRNDRILLDILAEQQAQGRGVGGLFLSSSWAKIVEDFNAFSGLSLRKEHLQNRLKTMKGIYGLMRPLVERSGWSIDRTNFKVVAPGPSEWDGIIAVNSKYASVRNKPFPLYYDVERLCGKNVATRRNNMSNTMQEMPGEGSDRDSNDPVVEAVDVDRAIEGEPLVGVEPMGSMGQLAGEGSATQEIPVVEQVHVVEEVQVEHVTSRTVTDDVAPRAQASTTARRRRNTGGEVSDLVSIAEQRLEFQREVWQEEKARREKDHTVDDAMDRLNELLAGGLDMRYFLAVCDLVPDPGKRAIFMKLSGPSLYAWLDHISRQGK